MDVVTYALMDNHIHLCVRVPERRDAGSGEVVRRVGVLYGARRREALERDLAALRREGRLDEAEAALERLRRRMDIPEIAAQASPTPMLLIAGERDHLFPRDTVERCFSLMQSLYEPNMLRTEFFDGEHECPKRVQARIVSYLDEMLK